MLEVHTAKVLTYLTSSNVEVIKAWSDRSNFKIVGGFALEKPVPIAFHPSLSKACRTLRPRRPVAPVIRTVCVILKMTDAAFQM